MKKEYWTTEMIYPMCTQLNSNSSILNIKPRLMTKNEIISHLENENNNLKQLIKNLKDYLTPEVFDSFQELEKYLKEVS